MREKAQYFTVRNWSKYQHYRNRNPPWIKLHVEILSSADWVMLADASKLLAIACMIIASRNDGQVPNNPDYVKRVAYLDQRPNFIPLIKCGFLENPLATASDLLAGARPETETETETEKKVYIGRTSENQAALDLAPQPVEEIENAWDTAPPVSRQRSKNGDEAPGFAEWYLAYPRKVARKAAAKAYATAIKNGVSQTDLIAAAQRYAKERSSEDPKFTKHPATWLNGECWKDSPSLDLNSNNPERVRWVARCRGFISGKIWNKDQWGSPPGEPNCRVPADVLQETGLLKPTSSRESIKV